MVLRENKIMDEPLIITLSWGIARIFYWHDNKITYLQPGKWRMKYTYNVKEHKWQE